MDSHGDLAIIQSFFGIRLKILTSFKSELKGVKKRPRLLFYTFLKLYKTWVFSVKLKKEEKLQLNQYELYYLNQTNYLNPNIFCKVKPFLSKFVFDPCFFTQNFLWTPKCFFIFYWTKLFQAQNLFYAYIFLSTQNFEQKHFGVKNCFLTQYFFGPKFY